MTLPERLAGGERPAPATLLDELAQHLPLIHEMAHTPQDPEWHAEGNVRIHTECVIAQAYEVLEREGAALSTPERVALILGAALHDIGKTLTTREEVIEGIPRVVSPRHTGRGRSYLAPRLPLLGLDLDLFLLVLGLVGHHHAPKKLVSNRDVPASRFWRLSRAVPLHLIYLFELADLRGRRLASGHDQEGFEILEFFALAAQEAGAWACGDVYAEWRERIAHPLRREGLPDPVITYVQHAAIRDFEGGHIHTPEEAIARTYEWRDSHPEVVITCAPSGSGKSSWVEQNCPDHERISLDDIRGELTGRRDDQSQEGRVLQLAKERLRAALRARRKVVWDATSLREDGRAMVLDLARDYHAATHLAAFACPPGWIQSRNRDREAMVPHNVIERQLDRLQWPEIWEADVVETILP